MQAPEGGGPAKLNDQLIGLGGDGTPLGECGNCGGLPEGRGRAIVFQPPLSGMYDWPHVLQLE